MQTLLIIDMQTAWLEENPRHDIEEIIQRINRIAENFRQKGKPIIFVRHTEGNIREGNEAWQVTPLITTTPSDLFVNKTACDSFSNTDLAQHLKELSTQELVICGLATEFCVDTTLRASLSHSYDVVAISDAHTTSNRPHLDAATIVTHHNWIWTHMAAPIGCRIQVQATEEFLATMATE